jgi:hypothetical protein
LELESKKCKNYTLTFFCSLAKITVWAIAKSISLTLTSHVSNNIGTVRVCFMTGSKEEIIS